MPNLSIQIFQLIVLYASMVVHEVSHGLAAYKLGDPTAKLAGRLSFNPLKHIDPFGTVILPLFLILLNSPFVICYAKPVPFNPNNFKNVKKGILLTGLAGPFSNLFLAIVFSILIRLFSFFGILSSSFLIYLFIIVLLNILFALFNLAPFPPFDGHHLMFSILPDKYYKIKHFLTKNYLFLMLIWAFLVFPYFFAPLVYNLSLFLTGLSL